MAKKQFKSESKRLMDMMINSIYTHKEIFIRELISNASDAIDKYYYLSLSDENIKFDRENFYIRLASDKFARKLVITDTGIGMTKEELETNLGTIAKSGSLAFKTENEKKDDVDIIGQFGVGFYSAFMVADRITVESKAHNSDEAFIWESSGSDGYTINPCDKKDTGTVITLYIKADTDDDKYSEYLEEYTLKHLVKKYSDYIKYPIKMLCTKTVTKDAPEGEEPKTETVMEDEVLNSMVPIWRKNKSEVTDEEYNTYYKDKFRDWQDPAKVIRTSADGAASYTALLYIPKKAPYDYYTKEYEKGLELYSNGVMIMEKCADLVPDCFSFVKGLVDSADLSLNISREILQHDRQLKIIASRLEKKIQSELLAMQKNDRENYEEFYNSFAKQLKFGIYNNFGKDKELLQDLIMFVSSYETKLTTLKEYVERMKEDQKYIYFASGESAEKISKLPQAEQVLDKGYEILYMTDEVDEFAIRMLMTYAEKEFKSISDSDLGFETEEKEVKEEDTKIFDFVKEALDGKVVSVKASKRLKTHPVCLSTEGEITIEMEKVLNSMPGNDNKISAQKVLEINTDHKIYATMKEMFETNQDKLKKYASVLYNSALLIEGLPVDDAVAFTESICELL
ncbi:MAG: molecular chaperone HtpG [Clostridia bacterium]|nr:molecular chaperone HtpG [Clostridia bacterium]